MHGHSLKIVLKRQSTFKTYKNQIIPQLYKILLQIDQFRPHELNEVLVALKIKIY